MVVYYVQLVKDLFAAEIDCDGQFAAAVNIVQSLPKEGIIICKLSV